MANSGGGGEFKSDIRKQEKMKFVSVGHHHAAGLLRVCNEGTGYIHLFCLLGCCFLGYVFGTINYILPPRI